MTDKFAAGATRRAMNITPYAKLDWVMGPLADTSLSATAKVALVRLLWHLNGKTGQCNPSYSTIARGIGRSRKQAMQGALELEEHGWIKIIRAEDAGRGLPSNPFEFLWDKATHGAEVGTRGGEEDGTTPSLKHGTTPGKKMGPGSPEVGTTPRAGNGIIPSPEEGTQYYESGNSEEGNEERKESAHASGSIRGSSLPSDWQPSGNDFHFALEEGLSHDEVHREADRFRDYWLSANGSKAAKRDWSATWRNWIRREIDGRNKRVNGRITGASWFGASGAFEK
jgi:hypothetical protein